MHLINIELGNVGLNMGGLEVRVEHLPWQMKDNWHFSSVT